MFEEITPQRLFNMSMHDSIELDHTLKVIRVAGGWIYTFNDITTSSTFVPLNNEFLK